MKKIIQILTVALALFFSNEVVFASSVLTFDGVDVGEDKIQTYNWPSVYYEGEYRIDFYQSISVRAPGFELGFSNNGQTQLLPNYTSNFLAVTGGDPLISRIDGGKFDLLGFSCSAWYHDYPATEKLWVVGYRNGQAVVEGYFQLAYYGNMNTYFSLNLREDGWRNLDGVRFRSSALLDDIVLKPSAPVPIPPSILLLGGGLVGLIGVRRKFR